jgi:hypothetical protein
VPSLALDKAKNRKSMCQITKPQRKTSLEAVKTLLQKEKRNL